MKNITVTVDDETYRRARVIAAKRDTSVSSLVKAFLTSLSEQKTQDNLKADQERLLDSLSKKHPRFSAAENLRRDELYSRQ